jgi:hypothetical protein
MAQLNVTKTGMASLSVQKMNVRSAVAYYLATVPTIIIASKVNLKKLISALSP